MTEYRTEEEQVEQLRRWWRENGRSVLITVALVAVGTVGWQGWQKQRQESREAASEVYEELLLAADAAREEAAAGDRAEALAERLREEFAGSGYEQLASLYLARSAVVEGDLEVAAGVLEDVLAGTDDDELANVVRLRLARVEAARGRGERALALLDEAPGGWVAPYAIARGDILLADGRDAEALGAYQLAAASGNGASDPLLSQRIQRLEAEFRAAEG